MTNPADVLAAPGSTLEETDVLQVVREHRDGLPASTLIQRFESKGFAESDVRRVVLQSLDRGSLQLGPKVHMVRISKRAS